jgi:hypothetical protein
MPPVHAVPTERPARGEGLDEALPIDEPLEAFLPEVPAAPSEPEPERAEEPAAEAAPAPAPEPPTRRTPTKKRGRASVPSWDEIMFGGGSSD